MNKVLIFVSMLVLTIGCKKGQEQQGAGMGATQKVLPTITVGEYHFEPLFPCQYRRGGQ